MALEWLLKKFQNFKNMNILNCILYITLKYVIWRFLVCNNFPEMIKFRDFMGNDILHEIIKIGNFKYFEKVITCLKSPDHVLQSYIYIYMCVCVCVCVCVFIFLKSEIFSTAISEPFREVFMKSQNRNILKKYLNKILISDKFPFEQCIICLCYFNRSKMKGGRGLLLCLVFCKSVSLHDLKVSLTWQLEIIYVYYLSLS